MIKLINLSREYNTLSGKIGALNNINITFPNKGFYSIIGRSGAGKTTLLNCIAGIDKVTSGEIYYNDINICNLKGIELDNYREQIGFIFQDYNLLKEYNVEENISLSMEVQGTSKDVIKKTINEVLDKVGLTGYNLRKITELSGGEQQRVVIARALAKNSKVIFCDEPTGNLDERTAKELFTILKDISKDILVISVTHNNILANEFSDGIVEIEKGSVINNTINNTIDNNIINNNIDITNNKKHKFGFSFISKLCFEHFSHLFVLSLIMLIIFICSFTIFTIFNSISDFNTNKALISTLKRNEQTIVSVINYKDYVEKVEDESGISYDYGVSVDYKQKTSEEFEKVKADLADKSCHIYNSYCFLRPFNALFNIDYPFETSDSGDDFIFHYHAFNFEEIISIDDFSDFSMPLLYGSNPKEENEILIYDYMADNLIYHKCFDCEMEDLIGKTFYDKCQDIIFKIAGIIKSNYQNYEYTDGIRVSSGLYGQTYLLSLKCIFADSSLVNKLNKNYYSVPKIYLYKDINGNKNSSIYENIKRIVYFENDDLDYIYKEEDRDFGYVFTLTQVSEILGLNRIPTDDEITMFVNAINGDDDNRILMSYDRYSSSMINSAGFYGKYPLRFYGIVADDVFNDNSSLHNYDGSNTDAEELNKFYVALNIDYSNAEEVLEYFSYPVHDDEYYELCIKNNEFYVKEGFCIYDNADILIEEASDYIYDIKTTAETAIILSVILIIVGIGGLCVLSIRKQVYKIGILKSLGAKNYQIELSYILFIFILAVVASLLSIPASFIAMNIINQSFTSTLYDTEIIMFSISNISIVYTVLSTIVVSLIASFITYIIFTVNPPVMLIRQNKDR